LIWGESEKWWGIAALHAVSGVALLRDNAASLSARRRCRALYGLETT
jgi:hypothetical protein